ncbi:hypothetical protein FH581_011590 [Leptospira weilii]|uniref:hypothetical protein n=2 Tax=Leptospira weilii TaxID=28184 RepID=UPI001EF26B6F|nr:hypothetical protein [Leptospira weilii]ULH28913.1 hypothetical protein FH586_02900 [Leptospira weilii]UPY79447.1 hypothetical protein FH581_011590 [Leptospira weilii]
MDLIGFEAVEITAELTNTEILLLLKLNRFSSFRQALHSFRFSEIMLVTEKDRKNLKNQPNLE